MTMSKPKAERVLDLICAAASEAVAVTEEDREMDLRWQKQSFYDEAKKAGNPEPRAVEISEKMDEWTRDLMFPSFLRLAREKRPRLPDAAS
jgi:hypothetical protein